MSIVFTSFQHPKPPISIKIPVTSANCLYLHDSYVSKFEFMNYLFASCVVVSTTEQHLGSLSLKGECSGSFESIHVKMPHCWKSHVAAHFCSPGPNSIPQEVSPLHPWKTLVSKGGLEVGCEVFSIPRTNFDSHLRIVTCPHCSTNCKPIMFDDDGTNTGPVLLTIEWKICTAVRRIMKSFPYQGRTSILTCAS